MDKIIVVMFSLLVAILAVFIVGLLLAWPIMLLWNWIMPIIFSLPTITFWQSYGLYLLSSLLIRSSGSTINNSNR